MQEFSASWIRPPIQEGLVILGRTPISRAKELGPKGGHQNEVAFGNSLPCVGLTGPTPAIGQSGTT